MSQQERDFGERVEERFDYIVCGAGTSGCVVAARLAADPRVRVLLVEAGGTDDTELVMNPNLWPRTLGTELDWGFVAEANPSLNGRAIPYGMGRVLGGGSSINVSTWSRGHRADWDDYAALAGEASWGYRSVLDLYRDRIERWVGDPDPDHRGSHGTVRVQPAADPEPFAFALLEAATTAAGLERFPNANGLMMESSGGSSLVDETVVDQKRRSIFRSYVFPLMAEPNLTVLTDTMVRRVLFEGHRAMGVELIRRGKGVRVRAEREVVLSLGAIHTPKLLMQSGIGDPLDLERASVRVFHALPGVGQNLHDHVSFSCVWEMTQKAELPARPRSQVACFWKSRAELTRPNFYSYAVRRPLASPEIAARFALPEQSWSLIVGMNPKSRGRVLLTGPNPEDPVRIDANYLGAHEDLSELILGMKTAREIGNSAAMRSFTGREIAPGPLEPADLPHFLRDGLGTFWHQSGTAKMGTDAMSVVDGQLRVRGISRLRVADASVLPFVTTGNTMAPCVVIGEKAAAYLASAG